MGKKKTLVIYGRLDNLNDYTKACRGNKFGGANMKSKNEEVIKRFIDQQLSGVHFEDAVKLSFRWYEPNKKRDIDNICFAKKFILDALVKREVIKTDGWKGVVGFTDTFFVDDKLPRIEVDIEEGELNE